MLQWCVAVGMALLAGPQDDSKKSVEEFRAKMKDAKNFQEKALAIRALGDAEPRDGCSAAAIAKYLAPGAGDLTYQLAVTAADALGKYRGNASASRALVASLAGYKKIP